ncbi:jg25904 [Pararge aegeria aegeria]|uniref:Jg25904 protein n=1 Tax=Pararge aegeria aegeria TaxID=348720 RepID=A0A8S4QDQ0_9NEOP|nr:jg25904 [Pararge aegeria aegeria]
MGRKSEKEAGLAFLGRGVTCAFFQASGNLLVKMEIVQNMERNGKIEMGRKSEKEAGLAFLGRGVTCAFFQASGNLLVKMEIVQNMGKKRGNNIKNGNDHITADAISTDCIRGDGQYALLNITFSESLEGKR